MIKNIKYGVTSLTVFVIVFSSIYYAGCSMAHYEVQKVTDQNQKGIRFNRPVPYLVITNMNFSALSYSQASSSVVSSENSSAASSPGSSAASSGTKSKQPEAGKDAATTDETEKVTATLIWLPEKKETYAITVEGGRGGTFKGSVNLANGWMLTGINQEGDTKTAEMLTTMSNLITGVVSSIAKKEEGEAKGPKPPTTGEMRAPKAKAFFYLIKIDLTNNALRVVNSKELVDLLNGNYQFPNLTNDEDLDPFPINNVSTQSSKGGVR